MKAIVSAMLTLGVVITPVSASFAADHLAVGPAGVQLAQYDPGYYQNQEPNYRERYRREEYRRDDSRRCHTSLVKHDGVWRRVTQCDN